MKASAQSAAPDGRDNELLRPELELTILIGETARLMRTAFDARMRSIGLTGASSRALFILFKEDGLSQIELARRRSHLRTGEYANFKLALGLFVNLGDPLVDAFVK